jgi:hypothetical protein
MLSAQAHFEDGGNSVEAGVMDMLNRMQTGRLRVAEHLGEFFDAFPMYHRQDGRIVKELDDVLCAVRYALMMLKSARTQPDFSQGGPRLANGIDFPLLGESEPASHSLTSPGVVWGNGRPAHLDRHQRSNTSTARGTDFDIFS